MINQGPETVIDPGYPFQHREIEERTFTDRLLRRPHRENALIELTNLLVGGILTVTPTQIQQIEETYEVDLSDDFQDERADIFRRYLAYCYRDRGIGQSEREQLHRLISLLHLNDTVAREIAERTQRELYREAVQEVFASRRFTNDEARSLDTLQEHLLINDELAQQIKQDEAKAAVQSYIDQAVEDATLSPQEEAEVQLAASSLNVKIEISDENRQRWDRYRLYWDLQFGPLPPVPVDIHLQKTETCYFAIPASWSEERTRTRSYRYHGPTARLRIAKGFYWRIGSVNVNRTTEEVLTQIDEGRLYFTNKRVLFLGGSRNTNIRLNRVLDFVPYSDGLKIVKDSGHNPIFQFDADIDIVTIILNRLLAGEPQLQGPSRAEIIETELQESHPPALDTRQTPSQSGFVDGRHYTAYVETVKQLKREHKHDEAIALLERLIDAVETEAEQSNAPVAPWYYEQLAIIYRKEQDYRAEIAILNRYEEQRKRQGRPPDRLTERLTKAQSLALHSG